MSEDVNQQNPQEVKKSRKSSGISKMSAADVRKFLENITDDSIRSSSKPKKGVYTGIVDNSEKSFTRKMLVDHKDTINDAGALTYQSAAKLIAAIDLYDEPTVEHIVKEIKQVPLTINGQNGAVIVPYAKVFFENFVKDSKIVAVYNSNDTITIKAVKDI